MMVPTVKNSDYWKERFKQLEAAQNRTGAEVYDEIGSQYRRAQKEIDGKINSWYQRFASNNGVSMAEARKMLRGNELNEFKWDVHDYIKYGKENSKTGEWMKQLENASARFHISRLEALKLQTQQSLELMFGNQLDSVDVAMKRIYLGGYYHTAYELQKGFGIGWDIAGLDQRQIEKVIKKPWAVDGKNFSERIWGNKQKLISELHKELMQNIMLGADPQKAIDNIAKKMNVSKQNAGKLVMTEEAYFSSAAQKDCFNDLDVERYEIVATLDSHTSDICQNMDGRVFPMKDYEPGVTAPPFHVWCRSTTVPHFDDDFGQPGERAARNKDGKTYYVPADMTYKEWEKTFVDDGDKSGLREITPDDTINTKNSLEAKIEKILDGTDSDRQGLGELILKDYGVEGIPVNIKAMLSNGYCNVLVQNNTLTVTDYNLDLNDKRSAEYQVKTAFHEAYHASGNGYATDYGTKNSARWLSLEETFAETSAHYKASLYGITDLTPAYPDKLVNMLPRLKQLPEFSDCNTLIEFGKVALEARQNGGGSIWMQLSKAAMRKKFSYGDYTAQYFSEIRGDVSGYVDKILENMPGSVKYKDNMVADIEEAMKNIEKFGYTLSDNEELMLNNAVAVAMNRIGVK